MMLPILLSLCLSSLVLANPTPFPAALAQQGGATAKPAPAPVPKTFPPTEAEQVRARNLIDGIFDLAKRSASKDKEVVRALAGELLAEAAKAGVNAPPVVYVLLTAALDCGERLGDMAMVDSTLAELSRQFEIDRPVFLYECALRMTRNGQSGAGPLDLLRLFCEAGSGSASRPGNNTRRALAEAEQQVRRCAGNKDDAAKATAMLDGLKEAIRQAKLASERLGKDEVLAKVAVPATSDPERGKARAAIATRHGDLDKKTRRELETLRSDALDEGMATKKNPPGMRYEYLLAACDLAARVGDTASIAIAVGELGMQFEGIAGDQLLVAAREAVKRGVAPAENLARLLLDAARGLLGRDVALAKAALKDAETQRERHRGSNQLYKQLGDECAAVRTEIELAETEAQLRAAVAANAGDKKAAEQLGWFLCTRREDWGHGLPLLAKGDSLLLTGSAPASLIATKELAGKVDDDTAWEIAEAWWGFAESAACQPMERPVLRKHAREWYTKLQHVQDVRRRKIEACLKDDTPPAQPPEKAPEKTPEKVDKSTAPAAGGAGGDKPAPSINKDRNDETVAAAMGAGLEWLRRHQSADGRWDCDGFMALDPPEDRCDGKGNAVHDVGATGLALLAFLEAGHTNLRGGYTDAMQRGLSWLAAQQGPDGRFANAAHDFIYDHAIATLVMAKASKLEPGEPWAMNAKAGAGFLLDQKNVNTAWRYQRQSGDNDVSVTVWCLAACRAAKDIGYEFQDQVWTSSLAFIDGCTNDEGHCGYTKRDEASARKPGDHGTRFPPHKVQAMTAAGLHCRLLLGQKPASPVVSKAATLLGGVLPSADPGARDFYYWFHGTVALRSVGGANWTRWKAALRAVLLPLQQKKGSSQGSWNADGVWGEDGGRVVTTAFACLCLHAAFLDAGK